MTLSDYAAIADELSHQRMRAEARKLTAMAALRSGTITVRIDAPGMPISNDIGPIMVGEFKGLTVGKNCCRECHNEIVPALDAYYGKDPRGADHCQPCRREMKIQ